MKKRALSYGMGFRTTHWHTQQKVTHTRNLTHNSTTCNTCNACVQHMVVLIFSRHGGSDCGTQHITMHHTAICRMQHHAQHSHPHNLPMCATLCETQQQHAQQKTVHYVLLSFIFPGEPSAVGGKFAATCATRQPAQRMCSVSMSSRGLWGFGAPPPLYWPDSLATLCTLHQCAETNFKQSSFCQIVSKLGHPGFATLRLVR